MLNLKPSSRSAQRTLSFLQQNPAISSSLFSDCDHDLDQIATLVEPILEAPKRCGVTTSYIQAVTTGRTTFLVNNLSNVHELQVTDIATSWLIGRSPTCAIAIAHPRLSRCHAVIGYYDSGDFYIADVGSSNGTFVNSHRLVPLERRLLRDGDLIGLGPLKLEFFATKHPETSQVAGEVTYC